ncbi:UmoC [Morganella morganii]|uniref:UmoC n=1 Tax=Morganella morganii TaxID=582 RepID=A0A433ZXW2_MORMO|nr:lysozyme inhibitor LprI family protein [Morganella morganii]RUT66949.1 UmoC [Morganella morganii]
MYLSRMAVIMGITSLSIGFSAITAAEEIKADPLIQCYQTIGNAPRTKLAGCLDEKLNAVNIRLNTVLLQKKQEITSLNSAGSKEAIHSLNISGSAFITFRDAECRYRYDATFGGSGAGDIMKACLIELTEWRVQQLQEN